MLYDAFLVLTVITAFMFVPTLGNAIAHYSGNVRAHAHVNHAFPLLIILGLFGLFVWQSGIVGSLGHAFENRAYAARNEPAWTPGSLRPARRPDACPPAAPSSACAC